MERTVRISQEMINQGLPGNCGAMMKPARWYVQIEFKEAGKRSTRLFCGWSGPCEKPEQALDEFLKRKFPGGVPDGTRFTVTHEEFYNR